MKKPIVIAVAGIYRSGSTWQFNVIKQIILLSGKSVSWKGQWDNMSIRNFDSDCDYHIIKTHEFSRELQMKANIIFTSHRSFDGVMKSYKTFNPTGRCDNERIKDFFVEYGMWTAFTDYDMEFDDIKKRPEKIVKRLAKQILKGDISDQLIAQVLDEMSKIKPPSNKYRDDNTLMFRNHIAEDNGAKS